MSIASLCRFTYGKLIARVRMSLFSVSFFLFFLFRFMGHAQFWSWKQGDDERAKVNSVQRSSRRQLIEHIWFIVITARDTLRVWTI